MLDVSCAAPPTGETVWRGLATSVTSVRSDSTVVLAGGSEFAWRLRRSRGMPVVVLVRLEMRLGQVRVVARVDAGVVVTGGGRDGGDAAGGVGLGVEIAGHDHLRAQRDHADEDEVCGFHVRLPIADRVETMESQDSDAKPGKKAG